MKSIIKLLFIFGIFLVAMSSCERDKCRTRGIECKNYGTCFDGVCNCPAGWTGKNCDTTEAFNYVGLFNGIKVLDNGWAAGDSLSILEVNNTTILLNPNSSAPVTAKVANNQFYVNDQPYLGYRLNGSGALNKDRINYTFRADSVVNGIILNSQTIAFAGDRVK
jgi:hypothetical protein